MAGTTGRGYPYPGQSDALNGPKSFQDLAEAVDTDVTAVKASADASAAAVAALLGGKKIITGTFNALGGPSNGYVRTISLGTTFSAPPIVFAFLQTTQSGSRAVDLRAYNATTSSFSLWVYTIDGSSMNVGDSFPSAFIAIGPA